MRNRLKRIAALSVLSSVNLLPAVVSAQQSTPGNLTELVNKWIGILNALVPWLILVAGAIFLNGFLKYIGAGGNEEKLKEGKKRIYFGFIGLFMAISFWGIVKLLVKSFFS